MGSLCPYPSRSQGKPGPSPRSLSLLPPGDSVSHFLPPCPPALPTPVPALVLFCPATTWPPQVAGPDEWLFQWKCDPSQAKEKIKAAP